MRGRAFGFLLFLALLAKAGILIDPRAPVAILGVLAGLAVAGAARRRPSALGSTRTVRVLGHGRVEKIRSPW